MTIRTVKQRWPRTCEYLLSHGVQADHVLEFGWDEGGYDTLEPGEGLVRYADNEPPKWRRPWPQGFNYEKFIAAAEADISEGLIW